MALRVGDWDTILSMLGQISFQGDRTINLRSLAAELTEYAKGMKALDNEDLRPRSGRARLWMLGLWRAQQRQKEEAAAKAHIKQNETDKQAKKDQPPMMQVNPDALSEPLMKSLSIASIELRAGILAEQGELEDAKKLYGDAAYEEKKLGYHEPPMYIRPVGETEAAALIKAKDYAGAKAAYETALNQRPAWDSTVRAGTRQGTAGRCRGRTRCLLRFPEGLASRRRRFA